MKVYCSVVIGLFLILSCGNIEGDQSGGTETVAEKKQDAVWDYYHAKNLDSLPSVSSGTPGNGKLAHGKLLPFSGKNFHYFDSGSYLLGRAFTHERVRDLVLASYKVLETRAPKINWGLMEASMENGGRLFPHRTHQNGLSIDFMSPLMKNGIPFPDLDYMGLNHYFMAFDQDGKYRKDKSVQIDFDHIALHLLALDELAEKHSLKIKKVILKIELKDELFRSKYGKQLKQRGLYFAQRLDSKTNEAHDDHYHIDFELLP